VGRKTLITHQFRACHFPCMTPTLVALKSWMASWKRDCHDARASEALLSSHTHTSKWMWVSQLPFWCWGVVGARCPFSATRGKHSVVLVHWFLMEGTSLHLYWHLPY